MNEVLQYLDEIIPNPKCELEFKKDYELLIAVCLSAQATDKSVNKVTRVLFERYPSLEALNAASIEEIKDIIKPIGTYNKKASFIKKISTTLVDKYNGILPRTHKELESLPGVGHKTASLVLGTLYNDNEFPVDTHVTRVCKRLGFCKKDDDVNIIEKKMKKKVPKERWIKTHHQMVLFGRYYCKAISPKCETCKIRQMCKERKKKNVSTN